MGTYRFEEKRRAIRLPIPTPSTTRGDDGYGMVDGSEDDVLRQLDAKNYGVCGLFEEWNGLTAAAAADLTTVVSTPAGGSWLAAALNAGTVAAAAGTVTLTTDTANNDYAMIGATNWFRNGDAVSTFNANQSKLVFEAVVKLVTTDVSTGNIFVGLMNQSAPAWVADADLDATNTPARIGFGVTNASKAINTINCDGTDVTFGAASVEAAALNVEKHLKFVYDFSANTPIITFYQNGTAIATSTTNLPATGTTFSPYFAIETTTGAIAQTVRGVKVYYL